MNSRKKRNRKDGGDTRQPAPKGKISALFDIPPSALSGVAQIELSGNREAVVDGCKGVLEYDDSVVKLAAENMSIRFTGRGLQIKVLTHDSAIITGFILGIEFLT